MATGALDANGIWQYGEDDSEPTFSGLLNKLGDSVSDQVGLITPKLKILQVVSTTKSDAFVGSSAGTWLDVTGLSATITPSSSTSKIMVYVTLAFAVTGAYSGFGRIVRGSTVIGAGDAAGTRQPASFWKLGIDPAVDSYAASVLDSPATTSATTYKIQVYAESSIGRNYINRTPADTDSFLRPRLASTITLMEVAA